MGRPLLSFAAMTSMIFSGVTLAMTPVPDIKNMPKSSRDKLVHKAYTLQEQTMDRVNWIYLGYAPRIQDPSRIKVVLSKQGFTMRVNFEMTSEEVADYPKYLKRRSDAVEKILFRKRPKDNGFINIKQIHQLMKFMDQAEAVSGGSNGSFEDGFYFLSHFFPENVKQTQCSFDASKRCVEGNFVYPITIHRDAMTTVNGQRVTRPMNLATPTATTYYTQTLEERRSAHYEYYDEGPLKGHRTGNIQDHLFDGFPAFWFKTAYGTKGQGIHGPIRYSSRNERSGVLKNDYLNDADNWVGINPLYRFEIVRTANSEGCIRSEPMEMRHMLPSSYSAATQVPIHIINEIDVVDGKYVDVDYYIENHYVKQDKRDWYLKHYITHEERRRAKEQGISVEQILDEKLAQTKVFPYLHPRTYEFEYLGKVLDDYGFSYKTNRAAPEVMVELNRAPRE